MILRFIILFMLNRKGKGAVHWVRRVDRDGVKAPIKISTIVLKRGHPLKAQVKTQKLSWTQIEQNNLSGLGLLAGEDVGSPIFSSLALFQSPIWFSSLSHS